LIPFQKSIAAAGRRGQQRAPERVSSLLEIKGSDISSALLFISEDFLYFSYSLYTSLSFFPRRPTNEEHSAFDLRSFEPFEVDQKGKTHR
jgi:hypothetical protein